MTEQNEHDDAIVLAALPETTFVIEIVYELTETRTLAALRRLKRAGKVRYVRETKQWEKV